LPLPQDKDSQNLKGKWGGVSGIAKVLNTDLKHGLKDEGTGLDCVEQHRTVYGANTYKQVPPKSFWAILFEAYKDPVILLLCAAALVSKPPRAACTCMQVLPAAAAWLQPALHSSCPAWPSHACMQAPHAHAGQVPAQLPIPRCLIHAGGFACGTRTTQQLAAQHCSSCIVQQHLP
jgi:hypothetical protein